MEVELRKKTLAELKEMLRQGSQPLAGTKAILIDRIIKANLYTPPPPIELPTDIQAPSDQPHYLPPSLVPALIEPGQEPLRDATIQEILQPPISAPAPSPTSVSTRSLQALKVSELRDILQNAGAITTGTKPVLLARIETLGLHLNAAAASAPVEIAFQPESTPIEIGIQPEDLLAPRRAAVLAFILEIFDEDDVERARHLADWGRHRTYEEFRGTQSAELENLSEDRLRFLELLVQEFRNNTVNHIDKETMGIVPSSGFILDQGRIITTRER